MQTFIHINCAKLPSEASAFANWAKRSFFTDAAVLARVGRAIPAVVATFPTEDTRSGSHSSVAVAVEVVLQVDTLGTVETRRGSTWVQVILTRCT